MTRLAFGSVLAALIAIAPAFADSRIKSAVATVEPATARPGQVVTFKVTVEILPGFHTYPTVQNDKKEAASVVKLQPPDNADLIFVEPPVDPPGAKSHPGPNGGLLDYYTDSITWEFKAIVSPRAPAGPQSVALKRALFIVCDESNCLPESVKLAAKFTVAGEPVPVEDKYREAVDKVLATRAAPKVEPKATPTTPDAVKSIGPAPKKNIKLVPSPTYEEELMSIFDKRYPIEATTADGKSSTGFGAFLLTAAFWGIVTLLTPCVFPMVPITVSVFLKQSEKQGTNPVAQAGVYAFTIVAVLGISAMALLEIFRNLSVNPWMNVSLGLLFVVFALSLFGLFELTVPTSLVDFTSAREKGGYVGTIFMGLTFSLISFTCVAPFLGGFAALAASGSFSWAERLAGAVVFAISFAAPFFLLALFPSLLKKLPKSGGWMNTIKVVMGFLEFAAALKFFRTAELRWLDRPVVFTYDIVMALWIATLGVLAAYLFGLFRLPHDHEKHEHVGVGRMLTGLFAIGLGVYLAPALFSAGEERNRPTGTVYAWVDAFLLPEPAQEEDWSGDLKRSLEAAREKNELVFVDFTGVTCTNCKLNEKNVFTKPEIRAALSRYRLVQIYTDTIPGGLYESTVDGGKQDADADANRKFQEQFFGTLQLPLYVIMKPEANGKASVLGIYAEGKINREDLFIEFLKKPFAK